MLSAIVEGVPHLAVSIITGVSAGAINAITLAAVPGSFRGRVEFLSHEWGQLTSREVYRVRVSSLSTAAFRWLGRRLLGRRHDPVVRGLFDMSPLGHYLARRLSLEVIGQHLAEGHLEALALSTTCYGTGETITFVQDGRTTPLWVRSQRRALRQTLTIDHVLASAAIPIIFPAVRIGDHYYGDGSVRQVAPLAPAVHLGATHILAIGMRPPWERWAARRKEDYPTAAQAMGLVLNSIFLDALDADAERLDRMNTVLDRLPPGTASPAGLRPIELLLLRPSADLGALARPHWRRLQPSVRAILETIGGHQAGAADFLSYLLFHPAYTTSLIELGYRDARDQWETIRRFTDGIPAAAVAPASRNLGASSG